MGTEIATRRAWANLCRVEGLDGDVERLGRVAGALEKGQRRGEGKRLVAQLIAGDEKDRPLLHLSGPWR
jgi:hypothetical protein